MPVVDEYDERVMIGEIYLPMDRLIDSAATAGFTSADPWLPLPADAPERSVSTEREDPTSMLSLYRSLLSLRRREPVLSVGSYAPMPGRGTILAYLREEDGRRLGVVLNLGSAAVAWSVPEGLDAGEVLLSASGSAFGAELAGEVEIPGDEALIFEVS